MTPTKAYFTRDSVCAGDDGDAPHARDIVLPTDLSVEQFLREILQAAKLPSITGGRATWCLASRVPLVVVAQEWTEPKFVRMMPPKWAELDVVGDIVRLHFSYFAQQNPDTVLEVLRELQLWAE